MPASVPVTEAEQAGQLARREPVAGVMTAAEGMEGDLAGANRRQQQPVGIHAAGLAGAAVKGWPPVHTRRVCAKSYAVNPRTTELIESTARSLRAQRHCASTGIRPGADLLDLTSTQKKGSLNP